MLDRKCPVFRGKGFGGSTILNGLRVIRGSKKDYDRWDADGWTYSECLPYMKKWENASLGDEDFGYHGYSGPLPVQYYRPYSELHYMVLRANAGLGVRKVDYNGRSQLGVSGVQYTTNNGRRVSTGKAYIDPLIEEPNVVLVERGYATKILINRNRRAFGVIFSRGRRLFRVRARREVILSGGVINSPQLLMLSGVGPAEELRKLGIKVIVNLPVGRNLGDHPIYQGLHYNTKVVEKTKSAREYTKEYLRGEGLYTIEIGTQTLGFYQTIFSKLKGYPDLEFFYLYPNPSVKIAANCTRLNEDSIDAINRFADSEKNFQIPVVVLDSRSKGTVKLRSKDPFEFPLIDLNMLSDKEGHDVNIIRAGIQLAFKLLQTKAFREYNVTMRNIDLAPCRNFTYLSPAYWECSIRHITTPGNHLMGTCPMGRSPRSGAVVDSFLRVFGVRNLRVVDTSVVPFVAGHTLAPTLMIAEKISDVIKVQNGVPIEELDQIALTPRNRQFLESLV